MDINETIQAIHTMYPGYECISNGNTFNDITWLQGSPKTEETVSNDWIQYNQKLLINDSEELANIAHSNIVYNVLETNDPMRVEVYFRKYKLCKEYMDAKNAGQNPTIPSLIMQEVNYASDAIPEDIINLVIYLNDQFWSICDNYLGIIEGKRRAYKKSILECINVEDMLNIPLPNYSF